MLSVVLSSTSGKPSDISAIKIAESGTSNFMPNLERELATLTLMEFSDNEQQLEGRGALPILPCSTCHPDYTYPPVPTVTVSTMTEFVYVTEEPSPSGLSTQIVYFDITTTVVDPIPTSGVTTEKVTRDALIIFSTTTLDATVNTITVSTFTTNFDTVTVTPSPSSVVTVYVTYCQV